MVSLEIQFKTFIYMLLFGHFLAFTFDFYRVFRSFGYLDNIATRIIDFIFCLLAGIITFIILLKSNLGEIRIYIFFSLGLGILIYNRLFSKYAITSFRVILEEIIKIIRKSFKLIKKLYKIIEGAFLKIKEKINSFKT
ncbi:spore cortex biosynthesis protein YabQ [Selenihalanaerobacter shriftii]|uniref:Spore cortex biosynthesis protein YabQ n=1 Tax=Selenihalanaerobacter shriftii TaxID=142842 RepID=A0A1T4N3Z6_9FIRM|nr:spore cortex biosynthesis protein YabQ [Selenihalanaerobacter shriftii]SJZ73973.1 spore cortex biosynthesis protein YabQ [Selenihalanaerobacter shriftii]